MNRPDFERAQQYALEWLERELAPTHTYHSLVHTGDEVVPAAERLAAMERIAGEPFQRLPAWLLESTATWPPCTMNTRHSLPAGAKCRNSPTEAASSRDIGGIPLCYTASQIGESIECLLCGGRYWSVCETPPKESQRKE